MKISPAGIALIRRWEGCELTAYRDIAGVLTVGIGHTGPDVRDGMVITQDQADALLAKDLARFEAGVNALAGPCTQGQFDALVSFAFNLGLHALQRSTLLKRHKAGDFAAAAYQFREWNKARRHGQLVPVAGLTARREAERKMYLGETDD